MSINQARTLRLQNPDSSFSLLRQHYEYAVSIQDTLSAVHALMGLAANHGHQADYKESYDHLWTALSLADAAGLDASKVYLYRALGRYYSFYKRKEDALKFLKRSLHLAKQLVAKGEKEQAFLTRMYHAFSATYRELNEPHMGQVYLDSSFLVYDPNKSSIHRSFLDFEQAVLFYQNQQYRKALELLNEILPWYTENVPPYQVLVYHYRGNVHTALGNYAESERDYRQALAMSERYHSHIDFTPLIYEKLSELYHLQGKMDLAYQNLIISRKLDQRFFDSRSENNRPLLEIQDAFRKDQEEKERMFQEQRLVKLEQEDQILLLQRTLLIGSLLSLIVIGGVFFYAIRARHRTEKELIARRQRLETQKSRELIELKNKELAAFALKLIEKDSFIENLKHTLTEGRGDIKRHEVAQIVKHEAINDKRKWEEFEARFVAVNERFYDKLTHQFPSLTQGDLKLCALLKLNFSSKEMAKLLGMSVDSVHTTRHRLRKKLHLSRGTNLKEFISRV
ncbi:MAG: tetratricopeptide repeat protein [Bacteroidota bacterium]